MAVAFFFHPAPSFEKNFVFVGWLCNVVVAQALSLRPGFLHRFAVAAFAIGLMVLPYVHWIQEGANLRAAAFGTGISNPNSLGMWFGFCTVYFFMWGLQTRGYLGRAVSWALGLGCVYIVALTISRGALLGVALACVVGLRSTLKRGFVPLLLFVLLIWGVYESGVFQEQINRYLERGTVESGRAVVWPLALERALDSLWTGVGFDALTLKTGWRRYTTPHNALLYLVLGWGIVPMICFLGYLALAVTGAFHILRKNLVGEAALLPPLVIFAMLQLMIADTFFMLAWVAVVFALATMKRAPPAES
jgi:hypothetical protein